jgi:tRNA pseudouridine(38-40) synthase
MIFDLRKLEKTDKLGFLFYICYDGTKFHSFDEMPGKTTIKSTFKEIMNELEFTWAKGIQQAGRTDSKVSANENILYVSSKYFGELEKLKKDFNKLSKNLKVKKIVKTFPNLVFPDMVEQRAYIYSYPQKKIKCSNSEIINKCIECSGTYDVSRFTNNKGQELKEHNRTVNVTFENGKLHFVGNSFMPKQVRIMSGYLLTGALEPLEGKYLILDKIYLNSKLENMYITDNKELDISTIKNLVYAEKLGENINIFYVMEDKKSEFIGKNAVNIKKLKKIYGEIVVREV